MIIEIIRECYRDRNAMIEQNKKPAEQKIGADTDPKVIKELREKGYIIEDGEKLKSKDRSPI